MEVQLVFVNGSKKVEEKVKYAHFNRGGIKLFLEDGDERIYTYSSNLVEAYVLSDRFHFKESEKR